jgi:hypothetical protein
MATNKNILNLSLSAMKIALQQWMGSHKHDGIDSTLVNAGAPAAGALAASVDGRAIMANNYFDAATASAKVANDALTNAFCDAKFAAKAFAADTASRAIFEDGIWTLAKLAATAKYQTILYNVESVGSGGSISARPLYFVPTGLTATLISADIIPIGSATGIGGSTTSVWTLTDGTNTIVTETFNGNPDFPDDKVIANLGELDEAHKVLVANEQLRLSVTNGSNVITPPVLLQVTYVLADAAE